MTDEIPQEWVEAACDAYLRDGGGEVFQASMYEALAAVLPLIRSADEPGPDPPWEYVHRCPSCGRYFDSPSRCLPDGVMTVPVRERVPNGVRCLAMDGRCERVAGHAGPCVEGERGN